MRLRLVLLLAPLPRLKDLLLGVEAVHSESHALQRRLGCDLASVASDWHGRLLSALSQGEVKCHKCRADVQEIRPQDLVRKAWGG
jgi:hypothetical protein